MYELPEDLDFSILDKYNTQKAKKEKKDKMIVEYNKKMMEYLNWKCEVLNGKTKGD